MGMLEPDSVCTGARVMRARVHRGAYGVSVPEPQTATASSEGPRDPSHERANAAAPASVAPPALRAAALPRASPYVIAVVATAAAFLVRMWLSTYLGPRPPYILFYPTVMVVALLLGIGPGLVATVLASLSAALWILPSERQVLTLTTTDAVGLVLFTTMGVFMSFVAHLYRQARVRLVANEQVRAVTEERDARVRASEEHLRAITDTIPDPVFVKDRESRMLLANPATLEALGRPADQVLGRTDREIFDDPEIGAAIVSTDRRIMDSGVSEVVEERVQTPTGYRVFLSTKAPYRDAGGRVIGLVGIARDITERKAAEDALRRSEAILAQAGGMAHLGAWWLDISDPDDLDANPLRWS